MFMTKIHWIVLGLLVVGAGGYFFMKSDSTPGDSSAESADESMEADDRKMAFGDFVRQGGSYKCEISQTSEGSSTEGIAYIDGGKVRGEYVTQTQGLSMTSHVLVRDDYAYTWTSLAPSMGFKARVVEDATPDTSTETSDSYSFDDSVGDYDCDPWAADSSVFALPTGVTFTEINQ